MEDGVQLQEEPEEMADEKDEDDPHKKLSGSLRGRAAARSSGCCCGVDNFVREVEVAPARVVDPVGLKRDGLCIAIRIWESLFSELFRQDPF